ncbi:MAG: large-conductance mechanosensitive channel protein MscL [Clostridia bacterium]|nr:large-conductance mechanosensitive channel protein MscL [Clostridia bacterium]
MKFMKEFKEFALKGNVLDMAVGVIIGGAFGKIVTSLVNDIIMPLVGVFLKDSFSSLKIGLRGDNAILIGSFIQNIVDFVIVALCIFMFIKLINKFKKKEEPKPEAPKGPTSEELLAEIRDLLKENKQ